MSTKNSILKKLLVVLILIVMSTNFIMPKYVYAFDDAAKTVVSGIFYLVSYVGDAFIMIMQYFMVGTSDIKSFGDYAIKYSPGIIFSNAVPALDINFITATEDDNDDYSVITEDIDSKDELLTLISKAGLTKDDFSIIDEPTRKIKI